MLELCVYMYVCMYVCMYLCTVLHVCRLQQEVAGLKGKFNRQQGHYESIIRSLHQRLKDRQDDDNKTTSSSSSSSSLLQEVASPTPQQQR